MSNYFAQTLKRIRASKGLTQEDVAHDVGKSPATIGQYEQNKCYPPYDVLNKLINVYDLDANILFERKQICENIEIIQLTSYLNDKQRKALKDFLHTLTEDL